MVKELMVLDLIQIWSFGWITCQNTLNQISGSIRNMHMFRESIAVLFDSSVGCLHISRLERWFSNYQSVDNNSEGPDIDLV